MRTFRFLVLFLLVTPAFATKEPDRVIQKAYEEIADFCSMREIVWDVDHHNGPWTVTLQYEDREANKTKVWIVTNPSLKTAVDQVEKDVFDFPEGHERK